MDKSTYHFPRMQSQMWKVAPQTGTEQVKVVDKQEDLEIYENVSLPGDKENDIVRFNNKSKSTYEKLHK